MVTENASKSSESQKWPQILAILIVSITSLNNGAMFSWTSPFMLTVTEDKVNYNITIEEASYFTVFPPLGILTASLAFFNLNDLIGRKWTLMVLTLPQFTFWITTIFARNVYVFYFARFVSGMSDAAMFFSLPVYIGEISTPKVRGTWGNLQTFAYYLGTFSINSIGSFLGVKQTAYIFLSLPVLFLVGFSMMPESPYYYIMKGEHAEAKKSIRWFLKKDIVEEEFLQTKLDVERQISESGTWKDLFYIRSNRKALLAAVFLRYAQHMAGLTVLQTYTQIIFARSGGSLSPQISAIIYSGLLCGFNPMSGLLLEKVGRRKSFMASCFFCAFASLVEAIYFYLNDNVTSVNMDSVRWIPLCGVVGWIIFFSVGLSSVPTLMLGELFSASIKTKGLCVTNICFALSSFFHTVLDRIAGEYSVDFVDYTRNEGPYVGANTARIEIKGCLKNAIRN
ncbi:facilitated trehalose transporter Tret1-like isoform X2 [Cylas formicarius]|uniref:facilitated trehalose transporter Tret1-like isoform X2 n=1 Tax=Cylas formicarius TaxID=197179 RepID=UPI0029583D60|nr:facilitated trehalose transporter Tret1-like isoform X2 [Cylas formicarius]